MCKYFSSILVCCILFLGCKSSTILEFGCTKTSEHLILGSIGSEKQSLLRAEYDNSALLHYKKPIKVNITPKLFNKQVYKQFKEAEELQAATINIKYIDSIQTKPKYLQLELADKVEMIAALNTIENIEIKNYLEHNTYAQVLTNISIAFDKEEYEKIVNADAIFLKEQSSKTYALELQVKSKKTELIWFNQGVIFQYKVSHCCWQENKKHSVDIVDIVSQYNQCPKKTYRSALKAKQKMNHYKL